MQCLWLSGTKWRGFFNITLIIHGVNWSEGSFLRTVNVTIFVSGTFDLLRLRRNSPALNQFLNPKNNGDIDNTLDSDWKTLFYCNTKLCKKIPARRALTSDWSASSFILVACKNFLQSEFSSQNLIKILCNRQPL